MKGSDYKLVTYSEIKHNEAIKAYIRKADESLAALGYTEHSFAHVTRVARISGDIMEKLGFSQREIELTKIAAYMHDIGNVVNRIDHSQSGAVLAFRILSNLGMDAEDVADIVCAIGNHDEGTGTPVDAMSAALILADKSDVRRSRVRRELGDDQYDIHDRVNYSVKESSLEINDEKTEIVLKLELDTQCSSIMEFFEIFLGRMMLCRRAAEKLSLEFKLNINGEIIN